MTSEEGDGVRALYGVESLCHTVTRFRAQFRGTRRLYLGRKVLLYYLSEGGHLSSKRVTRRLKLSGSGASGIVESMRSGNCVRHGLKSYSGHRVCFSLATRKGGVLGRVRYYGVRVPRLLESMLW